MEFGLIALIVIAAAVVIYFLGFKIFLWCAGLAIIIFLGACVYELMYTEGKTKAFSKWFKKIWNNYKKIEAKFFKWLDNL